MKKKLGIIGVGSAGLCSLALSCNWLDNEWEVTSIYDPTINITGIGESTNGNFVLTLEHIGLELNKLEELDGTLKFGTKFVNWGSQEWINPLISGGVAIHFNTFKLKDFVFTRLEKLHPFKFKTLQGNISSVTQNNTSATLTVDNINHNFDYVIDCRGFPTDYSDYTYSDCSLVNHCLVHANPTNNFEQYTEHRATKNGWMFGVPLTTRTSYGYLYNDTFTTKEDAITDMADILGISKQDLITNEFIFKPYYANKILDGRILKNGNKALFFEPISATSIWMYVAICHLFLRKIVLNDISEKEYNSAIKYDLQSIETVIRYFYHGGSTFTTKFWGESKSRAISQLKKDKQFYKLVTGLNNAKRKGTPYDFEGLIFSALNWYKIAENFKHEYFDNPNKFQFEIGI
jgi:tryptophan halogenase